MFELTKELNEFAKNYQEDKEIIEKKDMIKAIYYIDNLYIDNELDVLMFLAALNLCNAYAKQQPDHNIYKFKKDIATLINIVNNKKISNLKISKTNDKGNLYIFNIGNIQFSYHDEKQVAINEFYYEETVWDGIRKQPCAKSIFNMCFNNELFNTQITMTGKPIKILVNKLIDDYNKNIITFEEIINNI